MRRDDSAGFAFVNSFAFLLRFLLLQCLDFSLSTVTQEDSLLCTSNTAFTPSDNWSCKFGAIVGKHFSSFEFWSSLFISRISVKRLLFSSRSELASCLKMMWRDSNSCDFC